MTWFAQSDAKSRIKEAVFGTFAFDKLIPQFSERKLVMVGVKVDLAAFLAACSTLLTGVVVSLVYASTPFNIEFGATQKLLLWGSTMFIVGSFFAYSAFGSFHIGYQPFTGLCVMKRQVFGDAVGRAVHPWADKNYTAATTLTFVLTLVFCYPLVNALVIGFAVIAGIGAVTNVPSHIVRLLYQIQRSFASKQGELLETPPSYVEGNQQPSYRYTCGRFRDYRSSEVCLITG